MVLDGQRLQQRGHHDPVQPAQSPNIAGQQVVLDDAPVLRTVGADDRVVVGVHQPGAPLGFAVLQVRSVLGRDHRPGYWGHRYAAYVHHLHAWSDTLREDGADCSAERLEWILVTHNGKALPADLAAHTT
jgi:hypothetical protein